MGIIFNNLIFIGLCQFVHAISATSCPQCIPLQITPKGKKWKTQNGLSDPHAQVAIRKNQT